MESAPDEDFRGYERDLGLTHVETQSRDAAEAVRKEYRLTSRAVGLRCYAVERVQGGSPPTLFRLDIGRFVDVDWTWEGATVSRSESRDDLFSLSERPWKAEVVEVDETSGHLYVVPVSPEEPCAGSIEARPFEFLYGLDQAFNGRVAVSLAPALAEGLAAATGALPVTPLGTADEAVSVWPHPWNLVWGPPGTGKTYQIGRTVARLLRAPEERILIVSTTNKSTDGVALAIGDGLREAGLPVAEAIRVGKGADIREFERRGMTEILPEGSEMMRRELAAARSAHSRAREPDERAAIAARIQEIRRAIADAAAAFTDPRRRAVVATAYQGVQVAVSADVARNAADGRAPFTTVVIDESGLVPRAAAALLSTLAARRVALVGDPRQLAPISRMARVLQPAQALWLGRSGLDHLDPTRSDAPHVTRLRTQYRMNPAIREVVSSYMYADSLDDADEVVDRPFEYDSCLEDVPKAIWYVLDEDSGDSLAHIRAEKGPGRKSWIRRRSEHVVRKVFDACPKLADGPGLFLSPFVAQARAIRSAFARWEIRGWQASTIHSQQGAEADYVIVDTVHAGSTAWPYDEWQRLINVALSRARQFVVVLASRLEMDEPFIAPLRARLVPFVLNRRGSAWVWTRVADVARHASTASVRETGMGLGVQLERRQALRPLLSAEQERLCAYKLDGKPRLVRGVAGSGKSLVLAHWLSRTLADPEFDGRAWVVYANKALRGLLDDCIREAWQKAGSGEHPPLERYELFWLPEVLEKLRNEFQVNRQTGEYDYDAQAAEILDAVPRKEIVPRCDALFVDEAQDFGPRALELLAALVRPRDDDPSVRQAMIFYDNAQNVYGRGVPKWSDLGLDMVGRSTVMQESFRSTRPVSEFALNVLYRLVPPERDPDHRELLRRGLVEKTLRKGQPWWNVHFNHVDGPLPEFRRYPDRDSEMRALADALRRWIADEGVRPCDIKILCNSSPVREQVERAVRGVAKSLGARVEVQRSTRFSSDERTLVISTAHSFKGYEAEIVAIPGADAFVATRVGALPSPLYVAMTRARSILRVTASSANRSAASDEVVGVLESVHATLRDAPDVSRPQTKEQHRLELTDRLGAEHGPWLERLARNHDLQVLSILRRDGSLLAEPVFCIEAGGRTLACFGEHAPTGSRLDELERLGVVVLAPGDELD